MGKKHTELPLLEKVNRIKANTSKTDGYEVFDYIKDNIFHTLRYYQEEALLNFHISQFAEDFKFDNIRHVLFHMATGSGKTDLMASLILYLFQQHGYQNFIFTVNANAILRKTEDNLFNKSSKKYLYTDNIEINGKRIHLKKVSRFPTNPEPNIIYIKMIGIQMLSTELKTSRENRMGIKDYEKNKVAILGDEAHHYSANTKTEKEEEGSWEYAINSILNANKESKLLEFTATIDMNNEQIYNKYNDKIIYQYALDRFIEDKFSKDIRRIQSNNNDEANMLNVVLLSEYRRHYAKEVLDVDIKPIILFKSQRIIQSNDAEEKFNRIISELNTESLLGFIQHNLGRVDELTSYSMNLAYNYYIERKDSLSTIVNEIKRQFNPRRVINANDSDRSEMLEKGHYEALNSLENPDNLNRVIFAVAKLTEGWDVLNLYDIVRISDSVDIKGNKNWTNSEAQLIGRGARYNPFQLENEKSYIRRFEDDSIESLLLETLHYHTINESNYITNLIESLDEMNLPTGVDNSNPLINIKVKPSFKTTKAWSEGNVHYNKTEKIDDSYYDSLIKYGVTDKPFVVHLRDTLREVHYNIEGQDNKDEEIHEVKIKADRRFYLKAMAQNIFYDFSNMKKYLPLVDSKEQFLEEKWLNIENREIYARIPRSEKSEDLTPEDILLVISEFLKEVQQHIYKGYLKERGTNIFVGYPINEYISDYKKRIPNIKDTGRVKQKVRHLPMGENSFFVYESTIINKTEEELVNRLTALASELEKDFEDIHIIRMDENMHRESTKNDDLKLHQFDKNAKEFRYEGFQPDFIFYMEELDFYYQIFIEPKGDDRVLSDKWKEDILLFINNSGGELVLEDELDNVVIKGLKFYTSGDKQGTLGQLKEIVSESNQEN